MNPMIRSRPMDSRGIRYAESHTRRFIVKGVADRTKDMLTFNIKNAIASVAGI